MSTYDDGRTRLDADGVELRRYWFPLPRAKRIPWSEVRAAEFGPLTWFNGRGRVWGSGTPRVWLGADLGRPRRTTLITLDVGKRIRPGFTPKDPEAALAVLRAHTHTAARG